MKTLNIATACILNQRLELLVVRKRNTIAWMLPGGKLEPQEPPADAVVREVREELQLELDVHELSYLGSFDAIAANEADTRVLAEAFLVRSIADQTPIVSAEIAEFKWLPLQQPLPELVAPLLRFQIAPSLIRSIGLHSTSISTSPTKSAC